MLVFKKKQVIVGGGFNFANFVSQHGDTIKQVLDIGSSVANLATSTANTINTIKQIHDKKQIQDILNKKVEGSGFKII